MKKMYRFFFILNEDEKEKPQHFAQNWNHTTFCFRNTQMFPLQKHFTVSETNMLPRIPSGSPGSPGSVTDHLAGCHGLPRSGEARELGTIFQWKIENFHQNPNFPTENFCFAEGEFSASHSDREFLTTSDDKWQILCCYKSAQFTE